jgi:hypothetical protein
MHNKNDDKVLILDGRFIDAATIYILARKMILPFPKWRAFRLGLIDAKGKRTKKPVRTSEEKSAYTLLDRMIRRIRRFVGDRWFLKLSLSYLLLAEANDDFPTANFLLLEENEHKSIVDIGNNEKIIFTYQDNIDTFTFFISSLLGDKVTSNFGNQKIPKKNNKEFIRKLNDVFSDLLSGGLKQFSIDDGMGNDINISITYSDAELGIESITPPNSELFLGKFYSVFTTKEKTMEFQKQWNSFYNSII